MDGPGQLPVADPFMLQLRDVLSGHVTASSFFLDHVFWPTSLPVMMYRRIQPPHLSSLPLTYPSHSAHVSYYFTMAPTGLPTVSAESLAELKKSEVAADQSRVERPGHLRRLRR